MVKIKATIAPVDYSENLGHIKTLLEKENKEKIFLISYPTKVHYLAEVK